MGRLYRRRPALSRQRVLEAALSLIDRSGLQEFSMRKLGALLSVEAMALYNHVESKEALLDGIVELLLLQMQIEAKPGATASEQLWAFAVAYRDVLRAHPNALPIVATRPPQTQAQLPTIERICAALVREGMKGENILYTLNCLAAFVIGHVQIDVGSVPMQGVEEHSDQAPDLDILPAETFPTLHALAPDFARRTPDQEFAFGLRALLQGLLAEQPEDGSSMS